MLGMRATPAEGVGKGGLQSSRVDGFLATSLAVLQASGAAGDVPKGCWKC